MNLKPLQLKMKKPEDWIKIYRDRNALFIHDNNHLRPHPILRSGKHSNAFFNSDILLQDPLLIEDICWHLWCSLICFGLDLKVPDRVVGPAMGAIVLSHHLAFKISEARDRTCFASYTEKEGTDTHVFNRVPSQEKEQVLLMEDVITSGGSIEKTIRAIDETSATVLPFVVCLVNRSGQTVIGNKQIISLVGDEIEDYITTWTEERCSLCTSGSNAIRQAKKPANWKLLTNPM